MPPERCGFIAKMYVTFSLIYISAKQEVIELKMESL